MVHLKIFGVKRDELIVDLLRFEAMPVNTALRGWYAFLEFHHSVGTYFSIRIKLDVYEEIKWNVVLNLYTICNIVYSNLGDEKKL